MAELSPFAKDALVSLMCGDRPRQEINPGVVGKLEREGLAETYYAPTPYKTRKGMIQFLRITEAGRDLFADRPHA